MLQMEYFISETESVAEITGEFHIPEVEFEPKQKNPPRKASVWIGQSIQDILGTNRQVSKCLLANIRPSTMQTQYTLVPMSLHCSSGDL